MVHWRDDWETDGFFDSEVVGPELKASTEAVLLMVLVILVLG